MAKKIKVGDVVVITGITKHLTRVKDTDKYVGRLGVVMCASIYADCYWIFIGKRETQRERFYKSSIQVIGSVR